MQGNTDVTRNFSAIEIIKRFKVGKYKDDDRNLNRDEHEMQKFDNPEKTDSNQKDSKTNLKCIEQNIIEKRGRAVRRRYQTFQMNS